MTVLVDSPPEPESELLYASMVACVANSVRVVHLNCLYSKSNKSNSIAKDQLINSDQHPR